MLARSPRPVWLLGEGIPHHREFIADNKEGVMEAPVELWQPRARAVAEEGIAMARECRFTKPDALVPLYIRKPEAEEVWDRKHAAP